MLKMRKDEETICLRQSDTQLESIHLRVAIVVEQYIKCASAL
jgi:hypothetical protein